MQFFESLQQIIVKAVHELGVAVTPGEVELAHPADRQFGDWTSNIAFHLSSPLKQSPQRIADQIAGMIANRLPPEFSRVAASGGFLNFLYSDQYLQAQVRRIAEVGRAYGCPDKLVQKERQNVKIQVEFVSANPTGPLHVGNARGAPIGDVLANVLTKAGYQVEREYYHNDVGGQVKRLGVSVYYYYAKQLGRSAPMPEDGYRGDYVRELAGRMVKQEGNKWLSAPYEEAVVFIGNWAVDYFLSKALEFCQKLGISFNNVYRESDIAREWTGRAIEKLSASGSLRLAEGATWFAPGDDFLQDRECVVVKSDGEYTYFSNDIGYHLEKFERGFDRVIDVWGANHHGHVPRMKAALQSLGIEPSRLEVILYQWVSLIRGGEKLSMSKRSGNFVLAQDLLDDIGPDAFRFFYLTRGTDKPLELDIALAKQKSRDNPVYYVQYAHARICSLESKGESIGVGKVVGDEGVHPDLSYLDDDYSLSLIRQLLELPELVEEISETYAVHQLTTYAVSLADAFHKFYEACPILSAESGLREARLALAQSTKIVLRNTLDILGVKAPEKM